MLINNKRIVYVEWEDSFTSPGWRSREDYDDINIATVGWLVAKSNEGIVITSSVSDSGNVMDQLHIPKSAIRKFKYVKS